MHDMMVIVNTKGGRDKWQYGEYGLSGSPLLPATIGWNCIHTEMDNNKKTFALQAN